MNDKMDRRLAAVLVADIAGYSALMGADDEGTVASLKGHQAVILPMVEAFGGRVVQGEPIHGKDAEIEHDGKTIFAGLPTPLVAGRYHSLVADPDLPDELELTASLGEVVMGARHRELPAEGVQFHPESVLTPQGKSLLANFLGVRSSFQPDSGRNDYRGGN